MQHTIGTRSFIYVFILDKYFQLPPRPPIMSLDKSIKHGKEKRKEYRGSKRFDRTCRNHGSCPYCANGRKHKNRRREPIDQLEDFK